MKTEIAIPTCIIDSFRESVTFLNESQKSFVLKATIFEKKGVLTYFEIECDNPAALFFLGVAHGTLIGQSEDLKNSIDKNLP